MVPTDRFFEGVLPVKRKPWKQHHHTSHSDSAEMPLDMAVKRQEVAAPALGRAASVVPFSESLNSLMGRMPGCVLWAKITLLLWISKLIKKIH